MSSECNMSLIRLLLQGTDGTGRTLAKLVDSSLSLRDERQEVGMSVNRSARTLFEGDRCCHMLLL